MPSIEQVKTIIDDIHQTFDSDAGKRTLIHMKEVSHYDMPQYHGDVNRYLIETGMIQLIKHIETMMKINAKQAIELDLLRKD